MSLACLRAVAKRRTRSDACPFLCRVLLCQHGGCPGKRDPTFAQSLEEVLVAAHQRHLMLTAACTYTHASGAIVCAHVACPATSYTSKIVTVTNTIIRISTFAAKKNINNKTQATPCLSSAKHHLQSSSGPDPRTTTPLEDSALRQLLA